MTKAKFIIGIDPGIFTGVAVYNRDTKRIDFYKTMSFWECYEYAAGIRRSTVSANYQFIIETPNSKRPMYARKDDVTGANRRERVAANIGSNRREAVLLADGIELLGLSVKRVTPTKRKITAKDLERITGISARTSQHVRDAVALCWQM